MDEIADIIANRGDSLKKKKDESHKKQTGAFKFFPSRYLKLIYSIV